ncbi:MAG: adenylate/guanylate cyclase domain-containing protein [Acidimicrobiia bacterium]|nr:adenylate/guanylate cyclase domain-containing protein [Acidimicrobiia bacterium]
MVTSMTAPVRDGGLARGVDPQTALANRIIATVAFLIAAAAVAWGLTYVAFGEPAAGAIPLSYSVVTTAGLAAVGVTGRYRLFRVSQIALILVLPFALQIALGGFVASSAVVLWSFLAPLGTVLVARRRTAVAVFGAFAVLVAAAQVVQPGIGIGNDLPIWLIGVFFVLNVTVVGLIVFVTVNYFASEKDRAQSLLAAERERSERLLLNVLPAPIADELKLHDRTVARHHAEVSVLFADIVGFTALTSAMDPDELVGLLNDVFRRFDDLVEEHGCEKIRTIGDNYMVACGVPTPRADHAGALARLALDMLEHTREVPEITLRLGMDSGPVAAGVIGRSKFQYDLWGEAVNTASRMESHGEPDRIQVTEATRALLTDEFVCRPRGVIRVKGAGDRRTWFLEGLRTGASEATETRGDRGGDPT